MNINPKRLTAALDEIAGSCSDFKKDHPYKFNSSHEAWAFTQQELDRLWTEIKKEPMHYDLWGQRVYASRAAAMLTLLMIELADVPPKDPLV